jgi:hypothetical protein
MPHSWLRSENVSRVRTPVSSKIASFTLSRCWTLTVEITPIPASRILSMSWGERVGDLHGIGETPKDRHRELREEIENAEAQSDLAPPQYH